MGDNKVAGISDDDKQTFNAAVLKACTGNSLSLGEIMDLSDVSSIVEAHGKIALRRLVYSLADTRLLVGVGSTRSMMYQTTALGQKYLAEITSE